MAKDETERHMQKTHGIVRLRANEVVDRAAWEKITNHTDDHR